MSDKVLTVIVPSYNMEEYLPKCLGSLVVAPEWMERLEVLVVNDGSQDRTSAIAHEFAAKWPQTFTVIDKTNGNYGSCVNAALPLCRGRYVRILDADDSVTTAAFEAQLAWMAGLPDDVDLVLTNYNEVDTDGNVVATSNLDLPERTPFTLDEVPPRVGRFILHQISYRRSLFDSFAYRQTEGVSYTDIEWCIEPMAFVRKAVFDRVPVVNYLLGRAGQTVERRTFLSRYGQVMEIVLGLTARHAAVVAAGCPSSAGYARRQVLEANHYVYQVNLLGCGIGFGTYPKTDLRAYERRLREIAPDLLGELDGCIVPSNRFPFAAVRNYHRWRTRHSPPFWCYKAYRYLATALKILLKR